MRNQSKLTEKMTQFKMEFSEFFKGFLLNYTQEMSRTSLSPLIDDITQLKHYQNEQTTQRTSIHNQ